MQEGRQDREEARRSDSLPEAIAVVQGIAYPSGITSPRATMLPTCCKTSVADSSLYPKFLISRFLTRSIVDSRLAVDHVADERGQLEGVLSVLEQLQRDGAAQAVVHAVVELLAVDGQRADESGVQG